MALMHVPSLVCFQKSVCCADFGSLAEERGFKNSFSVTLFSNVDDETTECGSTSLRKPADDASGIMQCHMPNQSLYHNDGCDLIFICTQITVEMKSHAYPYILYTNDRFPRALPDLYTATVFAWDCQTTRNAGHQGPLNPAPSLYPHQAHYWIKIGKWWNSMTTSAPLRHCCLLFLPLPLHEDLAHT